MEIISQSIGCNPLTFEPVLYLRLKIDMATINGDDIDLRNRYLSAAFLEILDDILSQQKDR
jgi:hypothetical protein